jgi:ferredoxin
MNKIKSVRVLPGCVSCGTCEAICPEVFFIDGVSKVKDGARLEDNQDCIKEAAEMCPVGVIEIEAE